MNQKRTLYHYPLCPFSRKVRLLLYEKGLSYNMIMETPWARRPEFLKINPAGDVPVLIEPDGYALTDHVSICEYINEIKMSQTVKDDSFAREYLGHFTGGVADSWFDYDKLSKYRKLINPETAQKIRENENVFYFMSIDVGRLKCQTVVTVFKVLFSRSYI